MYLTKCPLRCGEGSARFSIGFPADILQETAVHQSRDYDMNYLQQKFKVEETGFMIAV